MCKMINPVNEYVSNVSGDRCCEEKSLKDQVIQSDIGKSGNFRQGSQGRLLIDDIWTES